MKDQMSTASGQAGSAENAVAGLAYLTFVPAVFFLITEPYNESSNVRFHAWQSILLSLLYLVLDIALIIVGRIPGLGLPNLMLWPLVILGCLFIRVVVMFNALSGKRIKIPVIGNLAEKQANG